MRVDRRRLLNASAGVTAMLAVGFMADRAAAAAAAADTGVSLEEIIVTAQRREENLQSVPIAVSAFTEKTLQQAGVTRAEELGRVTPSFTVSGFIGRDDEVSFGIRGQRTLDERITNDGAVIAYIAEVPDARPVGVGITGFLDLKSVEVVKGPVGTLFGRNTTGGAVLLVPNTPTDAFEGQARLTVGNYGKVSEEGIVNVPITDGVAFRVALTHGTRDGYVKNRGSFPDLDDEDYSSGRASLRLEKGGLKSIFYVDYLDYKSSGAAGQLTAVDPNGVANLVYQGGMVQAFNEQKASDFWSGRTSSPTFARSKVGGISNTTTYTLSDTLTFKNIIGYRETRSAAYVDTDGSPFTVIETLQQEVARQFSEEPQIQYDGKRLKLIAGAFYFDEEGWSGGYQNVLGPAGFTTRFDESAQNISKSVFVEGNYAVTDKFKLTLGARYTWDSRGYSPSIHNDYTQNFQASFLGLVCVETDAAGLPLPGCRAHEHADYAKPTFNLTGQYQFSPTEQVYASIRTGYRTGGFDVGSESAAQRIPYSPETITNYELGYKADFSLGETKLRLNAAAYYSDYQNIQKTVVSCIGGPPCTLIARVQNAAAATVKGAEVELTWRLTDALQLSGFYSYTDAAYVKYVSSGPGGVPVDLSNQPFAYLPAHQAGATARYTMPVYGHDLSLQANASYQSWENLSGDEAPGPGIRQGGYALANLRAEMPLNSQVTIALWARNVFEQKYYTAGINAYYTIGYAALYPGEPRTFGVDLTAKF